MGSSSQRDKYTVRRIQGLGYIALKYTICHRREGAPAMGSSIHMDSVPRPTRDTAVAAGCLPAPSDLGAHTCGKLVYLNQ